MIFNDEQQLAFDNILQFATSTGSDASLCILEGFAGTGKTTLVAKLLQALPSHMRVSVMAPTNKAVGVLQEKIASDKDGVLQVRAEFGSLHSFLGLRLKEREDGTQTCDQDGEPTLHDFDLAVIDECSMVSSQLFEFILRNKRTCNVLFVGDPAQLPPVNDNGMDSPVFRMINLKFRLNKIMRQGDKNPIIEASLVVRQAIESGRRISLSDLVNAFPKTTPCAIGLMPGGTQAIVDSLVSEAKAGRDCRAVAWRNQTVQEINDRVHSTLHPQCTTRFSEGEIVVAQSEFKCDKNERIFNSEELTVMDVACKDHPGYSISAYHITLQRETGAIVKAYCAADERALHFQINSLWSQFRSAKADKKTGQASVLSASAWSLTKAFAPLRHTYAVTSHKSQGSTFDTALLDWNDMMHQRSDFEFNRMVYVAMTRASKFMAIFAN